MTATARTVKPADISIQWKDVEIEVKIVVGDSVIPDVFFPLFPVPSEKIPSSKTLMSYTNDHDGNDDGLKCHICERTFSKFKCLKDHILSHSNVKPYKCDICGWGFHKELNLKRHMEIHSVDGKCFRCRVCSVTFTNKAVLSIHIKDAHGGVSGSENGINYENQQRQRLGKDEDEDEEPMVNEMQPVRVNFVKRSGGKLRCNVCSKIFKNGAGLSKHSKIHLNSRPFICEVCGWKFAQSGNLKRHRLTHMYGRVACPKCGVMFTTKTTMLAHVSQGHCKKEGSDNADAPVEETPDKDDETEADKKRFVCKICRKAFSTLEVWSIHMKRHVRGVKGGLPQSISLNNRINTVPCGKSAASSIVRKYKKLPLPTSSNTMVEESPFESNTKFGIFGNHKSKNDATKSSPVVTIFKCSRCPKAFSSKHELDLHLVIHVSESKPYRCSVCECRFHLKHNLERHEASHNIERPQTEINPNLQGPFCCRICGRSLETFGLLLSHLQTEGHTLAQLDCQPCGKTFDSIANLAKHVKTHSHTDKPHACLFCGWKFAQIHNMKRHMLTHTGEKPYQCRWCSKSYTDNYSLKVHSIKAHPSEYGDSCQMNPQ